MAHFIHTVKKLGDHVTKNIQKTEGRYTSDVYRLLAYCYKQLNKDTRTEMPFGRIVKAECWKSIDGDGDEIIRFKFQVRHDSDNEYLHIYEFIKCSISGGYVHAV